MKKKMKRVLVVVAVLALFGGFVFLLSQVVKVETLSMTSPARFGRTAEAEPTGCGAGTSCCRDRPFGGTCACVAEGECVYSCSESACVGSSAMPTK